ncbi:MAG: hypothetical protein WCG60_01805 [bacterium]|jgi:hypothetical protein
MKKISRQTFLVTLIIFWLLILFVNTYFSGDGYIKYIILLLFSITVFLRHKDIGLSTPKSLSLIYLPLIISVLYIFVFNLGYVNENWMLVVSIGEILVSLSLLMALVLCFLPSNKLTKNLTL